MTNGEPVIWQNTIILDRFFERTLRVFEELTQERILFINGCLTVHWVEVNLLVARTAALHEPAHRGGCLNDAKAILRLFAVILTALLVLKHR